MSSDDAFSTELTGVINIEIALGLHAGTRGLELHFLPKNDETLKLLFGEMRAIGERYWRHTKKKCLVLPEFLDDVDELFDYYAPRLWPTDGTAVPAWQDRTEVTYYYDLDHEHLKEHFRLWVLEKVWSERRKRPGAKHQHATKSNKRGTADVLFGAFDVDESEVEPSSGRGKRTRRRVDADNAGSDTGSEYGRPRKKQRRSPHKSQGPRCARKTAGSWHQSRSSGVRDSHGFTPVNTSRDQRSSGRAPGDGDRRPPPSQDAERGAAIQEPVNTNTADDPAVVTSGAESDALSTMGLEDGAVRPSTRHRRATAVEEELTPSTSVGGHSNVDDDSSAPQLEDEISRQSSPGDFGELAATAETEGVEAAPSQRTEQATNQQYATPASSDGASPSENDVDTVAPTAHDEDTVLLQEARSASNTTGDTEDQVPADADAAANPPPLHTDRKALFEAWEKSDALLASRKAALDQSTPERESIDRRYIAVNAQRADSIDIFRTSKRAMEDLREQLHQAKRRLIDDLKTSELFDLELEGLRQQSAVYERQAEELRESEEQENVAWERFVKTRGKDRGGRGVGVSTALDRRAQRVLDSTCQLS